MSNFNKSYRIRTNVGKDTSVHVKLDRDYDVLEIMSLKIDQVNNYKFHTSEYGVIAGRVLANDGFGIPNAKISVFINIDNNDINDIVKTILYPYNTTLSKDKNGVRYNLLPNEQINDCYTVIGTFPEKQYMLDNNSVLEIFDKYYKFTTRTNNAGDYMIFGVPVGSQTIHVDIDLSDIGILSQKPRDMVYKGYNIEQFENPNKFKYGTNLENLTQVISQDSITDVIPFWGDDNEGTIGITRCDINIQYKFEPTCIFMGSVVSDTASNGISKKCIPTQGMGAMDEITTGSGTIEMIRKTYSGDVEEFQIKGTQLINGDGVWCYQIPMNLDYMMTDEFGNMVPTNNPDKGIPTRTRVRFRISMQDFDSDSINMFRCKMLVPHNPDIYSDNCEDELDYNYGSATKESSYRDLFWNCVYSVKSYIPRIQKGSNWRNEKFTGFKRVNYYNDNNPIPYNNIRIKIPFMYRILCVLVKAFIWISGFANRFMYALARLFAKRSNEDGTSSGLIVLSGELCDDTLEYIGFIPGINIITGCLNDDDDGLTRRRKKFKLGLISSTIINFYENVSGKNTNKIEDAKDFNDQYSIDYSNKQDNYICDEKPDYSHTDNDGWLRISGILIVDEMTKLIECIEMKLAEEYKVIQFDFYNDWINGLIYIPRWMRNVSKKRSFLFGAIKIGGKIKACNENYAYKKKINIVQQCGLKYRLGTEYMNSVSTNIGCDDNILKLNCHKSEQVRLEYPIFRNDNGGIVNSYLTNKDQYVYYFKPYENSNNKNIRLFATDIILLGSLNDNDKIGIPNILNEMVSSTYQMPPNIALTDSEIEGNYYRGQNKEYNYKVYTGYYEIKKYNENDNGAAECLIGGLGKLVNGAEIGDYTEISGINWNYTGPLQKPEEDKRVNSLYKPGGHFLGLSCRNSETTIKTCVNLSRICEYGVWMSQRQELNVPSENGAWFTPYSTSPTGIISGDEIKGNEYRRLFATMNNNRLRVKKDKNGYFIYYFKYLNPTNFGGELDQQINSLQDLKYNLNRHVYNGVFEYDANVLNDDYTDFEFPETEVGWVNDNIVMRTNEYLDKEYYKFRFGLDDSNVNRKDEKKKRFLFYEKTSDSEEHVSFPMYDNSFYFYFGLHDGRTALDEFKKNYYAVCKNNETFVQNKLDKFVKCKNWRITYNGICDSTNTGKIKFDIEIGEGLLIDNYIIVKLINNNNDIIETIEVNEIRKEIIFDNLIEGNYIINITSLDNSINENYNKEIGKLSISATIIPVDFYQDVSNLSPQEKMNSDKLKTGGYIKIKDNIYTYIDENGSFDEEVFNVNNINYIRIVDTKNEKIEFWTVRTQELDPYYPDIRYIHYNYYDGIFINQDTTGEWMIPVPYEDREYDVYLYLFIDNDCKIKILSSEDVDDLIPTVEIYLGRVRINNGAEYDILYNDVSYSIISKYIKEDTNWFSNTGWWSENWDDKENSLLRWRIKENLYTDVYPRGPKTHCVNISVTGGTAPYIEEVEGSKEDYITITGITRSDFENVSLPTLNYYGKNPPPHRMHFSYKVTDNNNITIPEEPFIFPVIYKPFFMEMSIWHFYINSGIKSFLYGNIYNGKTWDYKNEGFNYVMLNGIDLLYYNKPPFTINITENDSHMEIDEPVLTKNKGGYSYNGDGGFYKYNGRKVNISNEVLTNVIVQQSPLEFSIGTSHVENDVTYSDKCFINKKNANSFYLFELKEKTFNNKKYIKYKEYNNNPSISPPIKVYVFEDSNENIHGKYEYPLKDGKLNINENLFRDLIDDKINMSGLNTFTIEGEDGYIDLSLFKYPSYKKYYYIAMPDNRDDYDIVVGSSNRENKIKSISVSPLIFIDDWIKK